MTKLDNCQLYSNGLTGNFGVLCKHRRIFQNYRHIPVDNAIKINK